MGHVKSLPDENGDQFLVQIGDQASGSRLLQLVYAAPVGRFLHQLGIAIFGEIDDVLVLQSKIPLQLTASFAARKFNCSTAITVQHFRELHHG